MKLWAHQQKTLDEIKQNKLKSFGLFYETGLGKTRTVIELIKQIYTQDQKPYTTLIVTVPSVVEQFYREFEKFSQALFEVAQPIPAGTSSKKRCDLVETDKKRIFITNYEGMLVKNFYTLLTHIRPQIIILDESHKIKTPNAKRTKALHTLGDMARYRFICTGTPAPNSYLDIWSQFRFLSPATFPKSFYRFRLHYFYDKNAGMSKAKHFPNWQPHSETKDKLRQIIHKHAHVVKKRHVLDLPPLIKETRYVELSPKVKKHYKELESELVTLLDQGTYAVDLAVTKLIRLQQLCSGYLPFDDGPPLTFPCEKDDALRDILESIGPEHQTIVWTNFVYNYEKIRDICDGLGLLWSAIVGGQKAKDRDGEIRSFKEGHTRVMIANPAAGGLGLNLQNASYMIYYSKDFNLEHNIQSEARAYRAGSEAHKNITRIDLITKNTVEEKIHHALQNKKTVQALLLDIRGKQIRDVKPDKLNGTIVWT